MALHPATHHQHFKWFKSFILSFESLLDDREVKRFWFWCLHCIPRGLENENVVKWIEFLVDNNELVVILSFLKKFLEKSQYTKLLEDLEVLELCIALDDTLEMYNMAVTGDDVCCVFPPVASVRSASRVVNSGFKDIPSMSISMDVEGSMCCGTFYNTSREAVSLLVNAKTLYNEHFVRLTKEGKDDIEEIMEILKVKLEQCQEWAPITAYLVIMGELYPSINSEERRGYLEPFARWMLRKGGLVSRMFFSCFCSIKILHKVYISDWKQFSSGSIF